MTIITLPPDLEGRLTEAANRSGTTPELLAVESLRRLFPPITNQLAREGTLFDFLAGYIGKAAGSTEPLSEQCGKRFAERLVEKQKQGNL